MEGNRLKAYEWNDESAYGMKGMWVESNGFTILNYKADRLHLCYYLYMPNDNRPRSFSEAGI